VRVDPHKYGESVLLAVSGGIDSMVMASLMLHYAGASGTKKAVQLAVAHCNFHLRGDESDRDERFVREWARSNSLPCYVAGFDTAGYAESHGVSIEMAARELRYEFFNDLCAEHGFAGTCVAHNANDNAETLLLNLVRGTGLAGACAMNEVARNPQGNSLIFRPLLPYSRDDIAEYAAKWSIAWCEDSTNAENDARRNVIRNVVFPVLKQLNPSLVKTLNSDIAHFCQAKKIVDAAVPVLDFSSGVSISELLAAPFWKYSLFESLSVYGFNTPVIESLASLLESEGIISGKCFEAQQWRVVTTTDKLLLEKRSDKIELPEVKVELLDWDGSQSPVTERGVSLIDAAALHGEPVLRPWQEGDYLQPLGMKGKKKVSDLLTDLKYSISAKKKVLVVAGNGSHVLAVVGERIDASAAVSPATGKVYRISIL